LTKSLTEEREGAFEEELTILRVEIELVLVAER
jgi:hypothetical protein